MERRGKDGEEREEWRGEGRMERRGKNGERNFSEEIRIEAKTDENASRYRSLLPFPSFHAP